MTKDSSRFWRTFATGSKWHRTVLLGILLSQPCPTPNLAIPDPADAPALRWDSAAPVRAGTGARFATTDPDATYATKGETPARLGYYDNYLIGNTVA